MEHVAALQSGCITNKLGGILSQALAASRYLAVLQGALSVPVLLGVGHRHQDSLSEPIRNRTQIWHFIHQVVCDLVKKHQAVM